MDYTPVTPFGRTIDAVMLKHHAAAQADLPPQGANKWEVLRELSTARVAFGLSDRDLSVLQALVSFHPGAILGGNEGNLVVHPSNASICERLNGMPCSTMRRHLGHLVSAGVIVRRDSPNGKRYARRFGDEKVAYGFDLSPLVQRLSEFCQAAQAVRESAERHKRLREAVSLMRRDLAALATFGAQDRPDLSIWDSFADLAVLTARDLRRKLSLAELGEIEEALRGALDKARGLIETTETKNMSSSDAPNEQHYQNSNKDSYDFEPCLEKAEGEGGALEEREVLDGKLPNIPLGLVLSACQEFKVYSKDPVRHWHDLVRTADVLRPMLGISASAWDDAKRLMGPEEAAVVLVAMLERFAEIRSPGGYLRALTQKAAEQSFSCGPMVMALMRKDAA
ncbi:MAG: plasmid replication protein RepC [Maritimibacter sp.]